MSLDHSQSKSFDESLSALMDNEADDLELRRVLKELPENPALLATWGRFHEAQSVIHNEEMQPLSHSACNRILDAIAAEPAFTGKGVIASRVNKDLDKSRWWESAGRMAIAASVALVAFVGLQSLLLAPVPQQSLADQSADAASEELIVTDNIASLDQPSGFDAQAQQRLDDYIRSVSIQYREEAAGVPQSNILQDSQLIRQVNKIGN
jgi:negative regulator of sigma E activity